MNKSYIIITLLLSILFFESCRKEEITEKEPKIETEDPSEIEYPVVTGLVSNNGELIPDAIVKVFQNEALVGTVTTDQDGKFNTAKYELEKDSKVTLEISKPEFANAYRRSEIDNFVGRELEVNLVALEELDIESSPIGDPGSTDWLSLSGHIKDLLGQPSIAHIRAQWEMDNIYYSAMTSPDLNGYYEMLIPYDLEIKLSISDTICNNYLTEEEVVIFTSLQAEYFGPFEDDVVLQDYINPITSKPIITIDGVVKDCNGEPSQGSEITFQFNDNETFDYYIVTSLGADGVFSYANSLCLKLPYDLTIFANDYENNKTTDTVLYSILEPETQISLPDFLSCNDGDLSVSEVTVVSDGVPYVFSNTIVRKENGDLISDELTINAATFEISNVVLGMNTMTNFSALNWVSGAAFIAVGGPIQLEITALSDHQAIGTFIGTFTNTNNEIVEATGHVNLNF